MCEKAAHMATKQTYTSHAETPNHTVTHFPEEILRWICIGQTAPKIFRFQDHLPSQSHCCPEQMTDETHGPRENPTFFQMY